jgi:hypothetical protein
VLGVTSGSGTGRRTLVVPVRYDGSVDRRTERLGGSSRLLRQPDDGAFDRQFWRQVPPARRIELVWDMVVEWLAWRGGTDGEPRLQRSVCRLERRGR